MLGSDSCESDLEKVTPLSIFFGVLGDQREQSGFGGGGEMFRRILGDFEVQPLPSPSGVGKDLVWHGFGDGRSREDVDLVQRICQLELVDDLRGVVSPCCIFSAANFFDRGADKDIGKEEAMEEHPLGFLAVGMRRP